jgi:receptor-type tyrosine-protein phosphatase gamma
LSCRKYFNESYYYLDESSPSTPSPSVVPDWDTESAVSSGGSESSKMSTAIPAHLYIQRVASLHAEGDVGFAKEFEAIQAMSEQESIPSETAQLPDNQQKNRYPNVVACEIYAKAYVLDAFHLHNLFFFQMITPGCSFAHCLVKSGVNI